MSNKATDNQELTLKDLIAYAGTSQRELSNKLGLHERTLNDWVARRKIPRLDNALVIAKELKVSVKTLAKSMGLDTTGIPDDLPRGKYD
jgi:transcriptional regulator with XRE-family HTH domain